MATFKLCILLKLFLQAFAWFFTRPPCLRCENWTLALEEIQLLSARLVVHGLSDQSTAAPPHYPQVYSLRSPPVDA